jgi:DNA-binding transcriptional MerR regulator
LERTEAIRTALGLGMPLDEISEYLDWLDAMGRGPAAPHPSPGDRGPENEDQ